MTYIWDLLKIRYAMLTLNKKKNQIRQLDPP